MSSAAKIRSGNKIKVLDSSGSQGHTRRHGNRLASGTCVLGRSDQVTLFDVSLFGRRLARGLDDLRHVVISAGVHAAV
jgi:hypothetical protein